MRKFFIFMFLFLSIPSAFAQGLDDLFADEDFISDLPPVETQTQAPPVRTDLPVVQTPVTTTPVPVVAPSQQMPQPVRPVTETLQPSNEAGLLSRLSSSTPAVPQVGQGTTPKLPDLGKKKKTSSNEESLSLFERRMMKAGSFQTDASQFDISGIMLGMSPEEVIEVAMANGFSLKFSNSKIPLFLEWKYKLECQKQNLIQFAAVKNCIKETAQSNNERYIEKLVFEKPSHKETLTVTFTSNFARNGAYRIRYVNKGNHSWGDTAEGMYLKRKRRQDFWRSVIQKYGHPDDEIAMMWSDSIDGASLQADMTPTFLDASLVLEDLSMTDEDSEGMRAQDIKDGPISSFSF